MGVELGEPGRTQACGDPGHGIGEGLPLRRCLTTRRPTKVFPPSVHSAEDRRRSSAFVFLERTMGVGRPVRDWVFDRTVRIRGLRPRLCADAAFAATGALCVGGYRAICDGRIGALAFGSRLTIGLRLLGEAFEEFGGFGRGE